MRFVPYSNLFVFGKDGLLAALARLGRIYTEEDKDAFQVSGFRFQVGKPCGFFRGRAGATSLQGIISECPPGAG